MKRISNELKTFLKYGDWSKDPPNDDFYILLAQHSYGERENTAIRHILSLPFERRTDKQNHWLHKVYTRLQYVNRSIRFYTRNLIRNVEKKRCLKHLMNRQIEFAEYVVDATLLEFKLFLKLVEMNEEVYNVINKEMSLDKQWIIVKFWERNPTWNYPWCLSKSIHF